LHILAPLSFPLYEKAMTGINCDGLATRFADREGQEAAKLDSLCCVSRSEAASKRSQPLASLAAWQC